MNNDKEFNKIAAAFRKNSSVPGVPELLSLAAQVGLPVDANDKRGFWLGSVGIRQDGVLVSARNGDVTASTIVENYIRIPNSHAEGRVLRKMGNGGVIYVARISKKDGSYAMARPCVICQNRIYGRKIEKVYYTIDQNHYGLWFPKTDIDRIFYI